MAKIGRNIFISSKDRVFPSYPVQLIYIYIYIYIYISKCPHLMVGASIENSNM